jgi:hypothetical protein
MQNKNQKGMSAVLQGVDYLVNKQISQAPFDKTYIGLIKDTDLETNTYTVIINGYEYKRVISMIRAYPNDTVVVMCPQNQLSQMFIYGKIDTTDYST